MSAKHTPGPWVRDQYGQIKSGCQTIRVNGVSLPCGGRPDDFDEVEANSNLIAAAPELLEALQAVLSAWNRLYPGMPVNMDYEDCEFREMQAARAAIAKATRSAA